MRSDKLQFPSRTKQEKPQVTPGKNAILEAPQLFKMKINVKQDKRDNLKQLTINYENEELSSLNKK